MTRLWLFCRWPIFCAGYRLVTVVMPAIDLFGCRIDVFVLFLLSFRRSSLDLPVTAVQRFSVPSLPFSSFLGVKISREAVCAEMFIRHLFAMVVAFNVLPGVTFWAVHGVAIIIGEDAYALDGVLFLILYVV